MPMIDLYFPSTLFKPEQYGELSDRLTRVVLSAEGVANPTPLHLNNTAAYLHAMEPTAVNTAATHGAQVVRAEVTTPPSALSRDGQRQVVREITEAIVAISGNKELQGRTWVILKEAAEGGWGIAGTAFGREEFAALAKKP